MIQQTYAEKNVVKMLIVTSGNLGLMAVYMVQEISTARQNAKKRKGYSTGRGLLVCRLFVLIRCFCLSTDVKIEPWMHTGMQKRVSIRLLSFVVFSGCWGQCDKINGAVFKENFEVYIKQFAIVSEDSLENKVL